MIVSREAFDNFDRRSFQNDRFVEAFDNFDRRSFQNDRFVRGLRQFSHKKLPKGSFRARLPTIVTEEASKMIVSREAHQIFTEQCFENTIVDNPRLMRGAIPRAQNLHFATVSCNRPTESYERVHPAKAKCASRYNGVPSKISNCEFHYSGRDKNV